MGIWSHTVTGIFNSSAFLISIDVGTTHEIIARALGDILMLGATGLVLFWILIDWIFIGCISSLKECSKDDLELPVTLASVENTSFVERIRKANILGSYKVGNHPVYGHAIKAFKELIKCKKLEKKEALNGN